MGSVHEAFTEIFPPTSGEQIHSIAEGLDAMTKKLIITDESAVNLKKTFKGIFAVVKVPLTAMTTLVKTGAKAFGVLVDILRPVGAVFLEVAGNMGGFVTEVQNTLLGSGTLGEKLDKLHKSLQKLLDPLGSIGDVLKKSIGEKLSEARKEISKWADSLPDGVREGVYTLLGILEGLGAGTLTVAGVVGGALNDLKKSAMKALETVGSFITGQSKNLNGYKDALTSLPAIVGAAVSAFAEEFKGAAGNVESAASRVYEPMKAFFTALKQGFDSISGTDLQVPESSGRGTTGLHHRAVRQGHEQPAEDAGDAPVEHAEQHFGKLQRPDECSENMAEAGEHEDTDGHRVGAADAGGGYVHHEPHRPGTIRLGAERHGGADRRTGDGGKAAEAGSEGL